MYAAGLFINEVEFMRNTTFARDFTLPLVSGFTEFWNCFLTKGSDGLLHDAALGARDSCFEGGACEDPVATLALIKRMASVQVHPDRSRCYATTICTTW